MSDSFERPRACTNVLALKRTLVALLFLACAMAVWPMMRGIVIQHLLATSVGFGGRNRLIAHEIDRRFDKSHVHQYPNTDVPLVNSCREPRGGMIQWGSDPIPETPWIRPWSYADGDFALKGSHLSYSNGTVIDADRDGRWEVFVFEFLGARQRNSSSRVYVLRFKDAVTNELVGIVEIDRMSIWTRGVFAIANWQDVDADGAQELAIIEYKSKPAGMFTNVSNTLAEFGWSEPGGVLVPFFMPEDGTIKFWPLPEGKPVTFSSDELVEDVAERVRGRECDE